MTTVLQKYLSIIFLFCYSSLWAQDVLDNYIKEGLENNIVLQQKKISSEKAMYSLKIATSYLLPSINLQSSYTSGEGGRNIDLPMGTLLNPVYQTLNQLTRSNSFPQINNVKQDFLPNKFYDVKVRSSIPVINTDLLFARNIAKDQIQISEYDIEVYKRELVKEITVAYFTVLSAEAAVQIYDNALTLAIEGKRISKSLLQNGKGLPVYVLRSENEIETIKALQSEAKHKTVQAKQFLNFLLNKPFEASVNTAYIFEENAGKSIFSSDTMFSVAGREEISMLHEVVKINQSLVDIKKHSWIPKVGAFVDLGIQDQWLKSSKQSQYYLVGIQLEVSIFEMFRGQYQTENAELDLSNAELNLQVIKNKIQLSSASARDNVADAMQQYQSSKNQFETARKYYQMILIGYQEGVNQFIETVDARTQLLKAELVATINKYNIRIAIAKYERETSANKISY